MGMTIHQSRQQCFAPAVIHSCLWKLLEYLVGVANGSNQVILHRYCYIA